MPRYNIQYTCPHTKKIKTETMFGETPQQIEEASRAVGFQNMEILGLAEERPIGIPNKPPGDEQVHPLFDPFASDAPTIPNVQPQTQPQVQPQSIANPTQPSTKKGFTREAYGQTPRTYNPTPTVPNTYEFEESGMKFKVEEGIVYKLDWITMDADSVRVVEELPEGEGFKTKVFRGKNPVLVQRKEWARCGK